MRVAIKKCKHKAKEVLRRYKMWSKKENWLMKNEYKGLICFAQMICINSRQLKIFRKVCGLSFIQMQNQIVLKIKR